MKKMILLALLFPCMLYGQTYISDLQNGDITAVERKLGLLNTSFSKEPILARYLENREAKADIVETLIKKGAKIDTISPESRLTPIIIALKKEQDPEIIKTLLKYRARFNMAMQGEWGSNLIDYALSTRQFKSAYYIMKVNAKLPSGSKLTIDRKYSSYIPVLNDQVDLVKKIIAADEMSESRLWQVAVSGSAKNVLGLLTKLYPQPNLDESTLRLLVDDTDLIKHMATIGFSLTDRNSNDYGNLWDYVIEKHNTDLITSYINIYPDGASENITRLLKKDPAWFVNLVDQGVKIKKTDALWETAFDINENNIYNRLIKCGPVPDGIFTKGMQAGDETLSHILAAGFRVSPEELKEDFDNKTKWDWMIKENYNRTLTFLLKNGYTAPQESAITALVYNDVVFPLIVGNTKNINKESLGNIVYGDFLAIEIAVKGDKWRNLIAADEMHKIFDPEKTVKEKSSYPQDRGRTHWKYYCVLSKQPSDRRGFAWAGYNDFLTNNFNVLCFLIAAKYDKPDFAEYILKRDPSVVKGTVFTRDETTSADTTYKYSIKDFVKKHYSKSSIVRLLR